MSESPSLSQWLAQLGLGKYSDLLAENAVGLDVLAQLVEDDLKDLGIPLGDRKRLLTAAKSLQPATAAPELIAIPVPPPEKQAERRQLTVMFCDLVGSTALAQALDPEQLRDLMRAYQRTCSELVERYEGHVAQYLGDGLMVYFGWPRAHEDDAERAVRASLEVIEAVKKVAAPHALQVRVGIATGPVVVGETGAGDASVANVAVGETPNLAARLQGLAGADQIVIAPTTHRLLGAAFEYSDLGEHTLKGILGQVRAWVVSGTGRSEGRFEAIHGERRMTRLVGRRDEVGLLQRRWELTRAGQGQVVLICGEPGIGKSRVVTALRDRLGDEPWRLRYQCSPFHVSSALHPVIGQFQRAAGFTTADTPEAKLDKLDALLERGGKVDSETAGLIAALLALPTHRYPPNNLTPQRRKEKTLEVLVAQVEQLAARKPVLLVLEDAHWVDPTSQEVFDRLIARITRIPAMLVVTYRPEYQPPWEGLPHVTTLTLGRLDLEDASALIGEVVEGRALPPDVLRQIVAKTDGVPLFVEELTRTVVESGLLVESEGQFKLSGPFPAFAIPSTLQDSLMARLDRLAPVKEVAQIAACIGREFPYEVLAKLAIVPESRLRQNLEQLVASQLLHVRGTPPEAHFSFKHALVQDAAYNSLLKSRRAQLHAKIAKTIEEHFSDTAKFQPEIVAHHYSAAGLPAEAAPHWLAAGRASFERSMLSEALAQFRSGLEQVAALPDEPMRHRLERDLQSMLGTTLIQARGMAAPEAGVAFERARRLCDALGESAEMFPIVWGIYVVSLIGGQPRTGLALANELEALSGGNRKLELVAQCALLDAQFWLGDFATAEQSFEAAMARSDPEPDPGEIATYSFDMKTIALVYATHLHWILGYPDRALRTKVMLDAWVGRQNNPFMYAFAYTWGAVVHLYRGDIEQHRHQVEKGQQISREIGFPHFEGQAAVWVTWNTAMRGLDSDANRALLEGGIAHYVNTGSGLALPYLKVMHAEVLLKDEETAKALRVLEDALAQIEGSGELAHAAEIHRTYGEGLRQQARLEAAERAFQEALAISRGQRAKGWELRAAMSLARLWQSQGKRREAREMLGPIYAWFTEGFDTKDLKEARALLEELRG